MLTFTYAIIYLDLDWFPSICICASCVVKKLLSKMVFINQNIPEFFCQVQSNKRQDWALFIFSRRPSILLTSNSFKTWSSSLLIFPYCQRQPIHCAVTSLGLCCVPSLKPWIYLLPCPWGHPLLCPCFWPCYSQLLMQIIVTAALLQCCSYSPIDLWVLPLIFIGLRGAVVKFLLVTVHCHAEIGWLPEKSFSILSLLLSVIWDLWSSSTTISWRLQSEMLLAASSSPFCWDWWLSVHIWYINLISKFGSWLVWELSSESKSESI